MYAVNVTTSRYDDRPRRANVAFQELSHAPDGCVLTGCPRPFVGLLPTARLQIDQGTWPGCALLTVRDRTGATPATEFPAPVLSVARRWLNKTPPLVRTIRNDDDQQPDAKGKLREAMAAAQVPAEIEVYPVQHGWCKSDFVSATTTIYDKAQAERAWGTLLALYKTALAQSLTSSARASYLLRRGRVSACA